MGYVVDYCRCSCTLYDGMCSIGEIPGDTMARRPSSGIPLRALGCETKYVVTLWRLCAQRKSVVGPAMWLAPPRFCAAHEDAVASLRV